MNIALILTATDRMIKTHGRAFIDGWLGFGLVPLYSKLEFLLTDTASSCTISCVEIVYRDKIWEIKAGITARDAIKKIGIDPESVLVIVNQVLVTDDVVLTEQDQIRLVAVISGGEEDND